jgi:hypothetical protein
MLVLVANVAALVGYYFLFRYVKNQSQHASALVNAIDSGAQKSGSLSQLKSIVKDTTDDSQKLVGLLLPNGDEVAFIEQIESLAKTSDLGVKTDNVSSVAGNQNTKVFQMQFTTTGSWSSSLYFLSQLQNLPYNIHLVGVSFDKAPSSAKGTSVAWLGMYSISVTENM